MTIGLAWISKRADGREDLYFAADSRTRGARVLDLSPKLLPLPRSDCALCLAGDTAATYPLALQISAAIAAHGPARERNLDITELRFHLLRVLTDTIQRVRDSNVPLEKHDPEFIFGGYSWRSKDFEIWSFSFDVAKQEFIARPATSFHRQLRKAAFMGDRAREFRSQLTRKINDLATAVAMEPLMLLAELLQQSTGKDSVGGAPQLLRIGPHMNTRPLCVLWGEKGSRHLYGRELFAYENCDYWSIDPLTGKAEPPKHFAIRQPSKLELAFTRPHG